MIARTLRQRAERIRRGLEGVRSELSLIKDGCLSDLAQYASAVDIEKLVDQSVKLVNTLKKGFG